MGRKLEEVKKDMKKLKENTTLSLKERADKYNVLDKELDALLNEKIENKNILNKEQLSNKKKLNISFYSSFGIKNLC